MGVINLNKFDWGSIVISAIENPNIKSKDFDELRENAIKQDKYLSEKIFYETNKLKAIKKIKWDKKKFFFSYESAVIDKKTGKRVLGIDDADGHRLHRHMHNERLVSQIPPLLIEKLEHPILSLIIKSETEDRKMEWVRRLSNELKDSQKYWRKSLQNKRVPIRLTKCLNRIKN